MPLVATPPLFESTIKSLPLLGRGKVRDIYAVGDDKLLIVTTDRLSAFDVILPDPIPGKGAVLTAVARRFVAGDDSALALVREPGEGRSRLPHHPLRRIPCWAS